MRHFDRAYARHQALSAYHRRMYHDALDETTRYRHFLAYQQIEDRMVRMQTDADSEEWLHDED